MANVMINIPDGSPELAELQHMVSDAQVTSPGITVSEYVSNIVLGYAKNRVINVYKGYVGSLSLSDLQTKLGSLDDVR